MIIGSSPYLQRKILGITGPTGATGITGPDGHIGATGYQGNTGNTGGSVVGMTLSNSTVITTFSDNTTFVGSNILGETGNYYISVGAENISGNGIGVVAGVSYSTLSNGNLLGNVRIRGFTTSSSRTGNAVVSINGSFDSPNIGITYNLTNIAYLGICGGSNGELIVYKSGTEFYGLTGTYYDSTDKTVDMQVMNYGERVHFVQPIKKSIYDPDTGNQTVGRYFYWPIDWEKANVFVLNSFESSIIPGERIDGQIVLVRNPPSGDVAKGITIVVPSGVTSSNSILTKYAVTDTLSTGITLDIGTYSISWPLSYPPCLTTGTDVINMISLDNIWYANFGKYNSGTEQVQWNADYSNCLGSLNLQDDQVTNPNIGTGTQGPPLDPICGTNLNTIGLCCIACSSGDSTVTTCEACKPLIQQGVARFFPDQGDGYLGCTAETDVRGICCYKDVNGNIVKDSDPLGIRLCDCTRKANAFVGRPWYNWEEFSDCVPNIDAINCQNSYDNVGACCDGSGNCTSTTQANCTKYWQGKGRACSYSNGFNTISPCRQGAGGCCKNGICNDVVDGQTNCIDTNGKFFGCNNYCGSFECSIAYKGCSCGTSLTEDAFVVEQHLSSSNAILPDTWAFEQQGNPAGSGTLTHQLKIGDEFAGGIVAGIFKPKGTRCFGSTAMGGVPAAYTPAKNDDSIASHNLFNFLNTSSESSCDYYYSQYDPSGYGFTLPSGHNGDEDGWLLIVSKFPVIIDQYYNNIHNTVTSGVNGNHQAVPSSVLSGTAPAFPATTNYENGTPTTLNVNTGSQSNQARYIYSKNFRLTHGGTAFSSVAFDKFTATAPSTTEQSRSNWNLCDSHHPGSNIPHDGTYGTIGATYWANTTTFNDCADTQYTCNECADYPFARSRRGWESTKASQNGNFSRNWGLFNTIRIINSDISEIYLRPGNGLYPDSNRIFYGGRPYTGLDPDPGYTGLFQMAGTFGYTLAYQLTTAGEACSIWNRYYYPSDIPPNPTSPTLTSFVAGKQFVPNANRPDGTQYNNAIIGNTQWLGTLYPQLSRWYIPSIDELAFIAAQCVDPVVNLQQKIADAKGIRIGNLFANSTTQNALPSTDANAGYVWSSTMTFNEVVTAQYLQPVNISQPGATSGGAYTAAQLTNAHFTKAWAMKFDTGTAAVLPNTTAFKVAKRNSQKLLNDNTNNRFELRLVRQIRCDRKFYWNGDNTRYRNTFWAVPRLTPSDVVTGMPFENAGPVGSAGFTFPNATNLSSYINDLNTFIGTIHKNNINNTGTITG